MTDYFSFAVRKLAKAGIESPRLETRLLLAKVLNVEPEKITSDVYLNSDDVRTAEELLQQRIKHKPLDKILGSKGFYKAEYLVSDKVLSPRPDSEILVEEALKLIPENKKGNLLDLGTGSGCLIESIIADRHLLCGTAVDISSEALKIARQNAVNQGVDKRITFLSADWFSADFNNLFAEKFDVIISNPPYIPSAEIDDLEPEVRDYDPRLALDGGADGHKSYRRLAEITPLILKEKGYILLEAGFGQAEKIIEIFIKHGFEFVKTAKDLSGLDRCVIMQKAVAEIKKI